MIKIFPDLSAINHQSSIYKVAILGAESTGKTTLAKQLADHYESIFVPEFAREFIENLNRPYTLDDIVAIAKQHQQNEQEAMRIANKILFTDTELIIAKVWCEEKFKSVPDYISEQLQAQKYDLYILTANDIPWENDPVRENPDKRDYLFKLYEKELKEMKANYKIIDGTAETRYLNAIQAMVASGFIFF
jgi:NadR type nicotinamide-nucleotide adenylyltransferase